MTCELKINLSQVENEMTNKPGDKDFFIISNISEPQVQRFTFGTLKSFLLLTDEDRDVQANIRFKSNHKLKFGDASQLQIYYDETQSVIHSAEKGGTLLISLDKTDGTQRNMMKFNPGIPSIAVGDAVIGNTGGLDGMKFDSIDRATFTKKVFLNDELSVEEKITASDNIKLLFFLNDTGEDAKGLQFASGNAWFEQNLTIKGILNANSNLNIAGQLNLNRTSNYALSADGPVEFKNNMKVGDNWLTNDGSNGKGLKIYNTGQVYFSDGISVNNYAQISGGLTAVSAFIDGDIEAMSHIKSYDYIQGDYLVLDDNYGTPAATTGKAKIYIASDGTVKIKHGNGTVKVFQTTQE